MLPLTLLFVVLAADPAHPALDKALDQAYDALRAKDYDQAVLLFRQAIRQDPGRLAVHKDLGYTLLKIGENEAARDQFAEAMRLDPADQHVALEFAYLCYETRQPVIARRVFDRLRKAGDKTAAEAFENIDRPLREGIARWQQALEIAPYDFSAHRELAMLAEQRDENQLAAEHYEQAWHLRPAERSLMLDIGRNWKALGREEDAVVMLLAASRGGPPYVAEKAHELLPARYPYVYEFEKALALDPQNIELRREYSYLLLAMDKRKEAEDQFELLYRMSPDDLLTAAQLGFLRLNRRDYDGAKPLLEQVLQGNHEELADRVRGALKLPQTFKKRGSTTQRTATDARTMAEKSLQAGYLKDALKYLTIAHENDPVDFTVMLRLGWIYNIMKDDKQAVKWFDLARRSPDAEVSKEATQAFQNLEPEFQRFRTTAWIFPFYSSRWHDTFGYGQIKTEIRLGNLPVRAYVSLRFIGDAKGATGSPLSNAQPEYLSDSSFIAGIGIATLPRRGFTAWGEAGEAMNYLGGRKDVGAMIPDYRGGVSYAKGFGRFLGAGKGFFFETNDDAVFVSRYQNDMLFYTQNRSGYTLPKSESLGGLQAQILWNYNVTVDRLRQYWANYAATGPGVRFRFRAMPKSMLFSINFFRGFYLVNQDNPRRPNFFDFQIGFWYAFTR